MTQTGLSFGILVIVIYLLFVICDLEFFSETKKFLSRSYWVLAASGRAEPRTALFIRAYNIEHYRNGFQG